MAGEIGGVPLATVTERVRDIFAATDNLGDLSVKSVRTKLEQAIGADLSSNPDDKTAVKAHVLEILQETEQGTSSEESELEVEEEDEGRQVGGCQGQGGAPDAAGSTVADAVAVAPPVAAKPKVKVPKKRRTKEEIAEAKVRDAVTAWLCGSKYGLVARVERTVKAEEKLRLQAQKKALQAEERARMHAAYLQQRSVQAQLRVRFHIIRNAQI